MSQNSYIPPSSGEPFFRASVNPSDPWQDYVEFRFAIRDENGVMHTARPLTFDAIPFGQSLGHTTEPMLTVFKKSAEGARMMQRLMDDLWAMGIRPTDMSTPGQLGAMQAHLEDMRALVATALETNLPGHLA